MNELKERIITYRWLKFVFYFLFVAGIASFLFTIIFIKTNSLRDAFFSIIFMLFAYGANEVCNIKIKRYLELYKSLKNKNKSKTVKVIDFEKIA